MPGGNTDPQAEEVIYIGETCRSLEGRFYQFDRSAFQAKIGHSGGWNYREDFGDNSESLYVAAFPVDIGDRVLRPLFIRYVERRLIWEYAVRWGKRPICNRK